MANTIAKATGGDATREKTTTRLGSRYASAQANTWRTFATVTTWADGHVTVEIERDGKRVANLQVRSEADTDAGDPPVSYSEWPNGRIHNPITECQHENVTEYISPGFHVPAQQCNDCGRVRLHRSSGDGWHSWNEVVTAQN